MGNTLGQAKAPSNQQALIRDLTNVLHQYSDNFDALPEANINDDDPLTLIPDVLVIDAESDDFLMCVEITNKRGLKETIKKVEEIVEAQELEESFVIHYKKVGKKEYEIVEWYRITDEGIEKGNSFSEIMEVDLDELLNEE